MPANVHNILDRLLGADPASVEPQTHPQQQKLPVRKQRRKVNVNSILSRALAQAKPQPQPQATPTVAPQVTGAQSLPQALSRLHLKAWKIPKPGRVKLTLDNRKVTIERRDLRALWRAASKETHRYGLTGFCWAATEGTVATWIDATQYPSYLAATDGHRMVILGVKAKPPQASPRLPRGTTHLFFTLDQLDGLKPWTRTHPAEQQSPPLQSGGGEFPDFKAIIEKPDTMTMTIGLDRTACAILEAQRKDGKNTPGYHKPASIPASGPMLIPDVARLNRQTKQAKAQAMARGGTAQTVTMQWASVPGVTTKNLADSVGFNPFFLAEVSQWYRGSDHDGLVLQGRAELSPWFTIDSDRRRLAITMPMRLD